MRLPGMGLTAAVAFLLLGFAPLAPAADEPEAVYAKFHRAAMAGDLEEMFRYGLERRRVDVKGMPASSKEAALKLARSMVPAGYTLQRKTVQDNGRATLVVTGGWAAEGQPPQTVYATVRLLLENGEWKLDEARWSAEKPAVTKPAPDAADKAWRSKPVTEGKGAPVVGSMAAQPGSRKLGPAKPECVYKPVMTAQDMENCK